MSNLVVTLCDACPALLVAHTRARARAFDNWFVLRYLTATGFGRLVQINVPTQVSQMLIFYLIKRYFIVTVFLRYACIYEAKSKQDEKQNMYII